jgi:UDP-N-acetylglucosamine 2-epimerase
MVGDVMIDALLQNRDKAFQRGCDGILAEHGVAQGDFFLATIHRASNTDNAENIKSIIGAFTDFADTTILLPAHPRLRKALTQNNIDISKNVRLIPPVGYLDMLCLTSAASLILTDSGGLQKEAYALRTRCVTLRDETEWTETLTHGWNRLAGSVRERIVRAVHDSIIEHPTEHPEYYGDGRASLKISEILSSMSH